MSTDPTRRKAANASKPTSRPETFSAADFPALRSFLRGYFNQDMKDEYGSSEKATREFCANGSAADIQSLAENWSRFLNQARGLPLDELNRILTGTLGSAYALTSEDVAAISAILSRAARFST